MRGSSSSIAKRTSEQVIANVGLSRVGGEIKASPPTFTQKAGMQLALAVGTLMIVVTVLITLDWSLRAPAVPTAQDLIGTSKTPAENVERARLIVENYKTLSGATTERSMKLLDAIVLKAPLPVFTLILGYIFGTRNGKLDA